MDTPVLVSVPGAWSQRILARGLVFARSDFCGWRWRSIGSLLPRRSADRGCVFASDGDLFIRTTLSAQRMAGFPEPHVCLQPIDVETWRFPGALSLEAAVRTMLTSIRDHGKVSGPAFGFGGSSLKACSNSPTQLMLISIEMLAAYGQQFRNADTLIERVGHLRLFLRILHREPCIASSTWQQLLRGARKHKRRSNLPRLRHKRVVALVQVALEKGWDDLARLVVVARGLLFKELVPSQASHLEGRGNTSWHSFVKIKGRDVSVTMRIRKNAPEVAVIVRRCCCERKIELLCCACSLATQVRRAREKLQGCVI